MVKEVDMHRKHGVPIMMDAKRPTPRHIIIKIPKVKEKETLKSSKRQKVSLPDSC